MIITLDFEKYETADGIYCIEFSSPLKFKVSDENNLYSIEDTSDIGIFSWCKKGDDPIQALMEDIVHVVKEYMCIESIHLDDKAKEFSEKLKKYILNCTFCPKGEKQFKPLKEFITYQK